MNSKQIVGIFLYAVLSFTASPVQYIVLTQLDNALSGPDRQAATRMYMEEHSLNSAQMMQLLDENIREQLEFTGNENLRDSAASSTLYSMAFTDADESLPFLLKYSGQDYPEQVRANATTLYIRYAGDAGFALATNVMTQPWRTFREHGSIRIEFYNQAKTASQENKGKYVDFLKWAILHAEGSTSATIDDHLCELDSTWRTNEIRKINAIRLLKTGPNQIATNDLRRIIRDYEIASGLREPEPPTVVQQSPEAVVAESGNTPTTQEMPDTATQPPEVDVPRSRTAPAIGIGVLVIFVAFSFWKFRRR